MAQRQSSGELNRLVGKRLVFSGKFGYGQESRLHALAKAHQGMVADDLDAQVDFLVLADRTAGKTIQKMALSLNAKGAAIQVLDADDFQKMTALSSADILLLLRANQAEAYDKICRAGYYHAAGHTPQHVFQAEDFGKAILANVDLADIRFLACRFVEAELDHIKIGEATECDFSKTTGSASWFGNIVRCGFQGASLADARFGGDMSESDFTGAQLDGAAFTPIYARSNRAPHKSVVFAKAQLKGANFHHLAMHAPDFSGADLSGAHFPECVIEAGRFSKASLVGAALIDAKLVNCDFTNADFTQANLAGADLSGAKLSGANLQGANLCGAKLDGVDLSRAKNYDPSDSTAGQLGPALKELDVIHTQASRIQVSFLVRAPAGDETDELGVDTAGLKWGWGLTVPRQLANHQTFLSAKAIAFSTALLRLARLMASRQVRFESLEVSSTKSPKGGKELRDLVLRGISEAFAQALPPEEELAAATKKHREAEREKGAAERERRAAAKKAVEKEKQKAKKQIAKKIEKAVGKVSDVASFLKALELRIEKPKIDKATKMLKASGFKLFNDVTDEHVSGVVKSQSDPDLVYACRVAHDGQYSCCTQNLNVCGGLRGSLCKHQLVLIIGLVQAGELDPTTIDSWIAKTHSVKPELDKETMGAIFIKYKGAEAGEVDWRPTETVPEDYYAL